MHQLYTSLDISTLDVIEAASTKWNFMKLTPGLVGGHCISIDPYYLMHKSEVSGYVPNIMRAARKINDEMHEWVFHDFMRTMKLKNINLDSAVITIFGYTFKQNCSDSRNTKVKNLMLLMKKNGIKFNLWDPLISEQDHQELNNLGFQTLKSSPNNTEIAFVCVCHDEIIKYLNDFHGVIYDYKNSYRAD